MLIFNVATDLPLNVRKALDFTDGKNWGFTDMHQFFPRHKDSRSSIRISKGLNSEFNVLPTVLHSHIVKRNVHPNTLLP